MSDQILFYVEGEPVPKQSYRAAKGGGYTDPRVKAWQNLVAVRAREVMQGKSPLAGPIVMEVIFILGNHRIVDLDNLNKAICDACNGIIFEDDSQVFSLHLEKYIDKKKSGVRVIVQQATTIRGIE